MTNTNNTKQASDFDNFAYNIAPQFEDGFYGYAVDKDFSMSIVQMYLDCETEEDEKKVDRALRKLRNFHLSMDRGHLKNRAKYLGEEMFKDSNFKDYIKRQNERYSSKEEEQEENQGVEAEKENLVPTRPTRMTKSDNNSDNKIVEAPESLIIAAEEAQKPDNRTYEEKVEGMKDFYDATDPDGKKAESLMNKAKEALGDDEYAIMRNAYNKPETYQRLCNLWDYFHRNRPDNWPQRPDL